MSQNQQSLSQMERNDVTGFKTAPWIDGLVFCGLISAGIGARLLCHDLPNFAPVAALALFAGYFFAARILAIMVPVLVMLGSDWILGSYNPGLMIVDIAGVVTWPVATKPRLHIRSPACNRFFKSPCHQLQHDGIDCLFPRYQPGRLVSSELVPC